MIVSLNLLVNLILTGIFVIKKEAIVQNIQYHIQYKVLNIIDNLNIALDFKSLIHQYLVYLIQQIQRLAHHQKNAVPFKVYIKCVL